MNVPCNLPTHGIGAPPCQRLPAGRPASISRPSAFPGIVPLDLLLIAHPGMLRAEAPGRLFFTPDERAAIERRLAATQTESPRGESLHLQGEVRHRSGARTLWLNGRPRHDSQPAPKRTLSPRPPGDYAEGLADSPGLVRIGDMTAGIGSTLHPELGQVIAPFTGRLVVHPVGRRQPGHRPAPP